MLKVEVPVKRYSYFYTFLLKERKDEKVRFDCFVGESYYW